MLRPFLLASLLCLAATGCRSDDRDGDGFTPDDGDCDDESALVHPDAEEVCDGVDNDCNGEVDDDATDALVIWTDDDGDGFGDLESEVRSCEPDPEGTADNADDCDDGDPDVHPDAEEVCNDVDDDCDGETDVGASDALTWYADADADGYGSAAYWTESCDPIEGWVDNADDCDDTSADAHPGGQEVCDGLDNDCNDLIDDGALDPVTWYRDADADTWGDDLDTLVICTGPEGWVLEGGDCDDGDPSIHPEADEVCDGFDQDCDGTPDDDPVDGATWYFDYDADGYGVPTLTTIACDPPPGYADNPDDCDDRRDESYPGADEICDGRDNDCDGTSDEDATDATTWYADADADRYGDAATSVTSCTRPSGYVADATDCDDAVAAIHPGAEETCNDVDDDCDREVDEDATDADPWYADSDGDSWGNAAYVVYACDQPTGYGPSYGDCNDADAAIHPEADEICDLADNDCDGSVDEADAVDASTWYADADGDDYGDAATTRTACTRPAGYVADDTDCDDTDTEVHPDVEEICNDGVDNDCSGDFGPCWEDLADADTILTGEATADYAGTSVAGAGDLDGDGIADIVVGAEYRDDGTITDVGATYLFYGPAPSGVTSLGTADVILLGEAGSDQSSTTHAGGGDVDGDGTPDLLVGGKRNASGIGTATGAAYLFYGPVSASATSLGDADAKISGNSAWDFAGIHVAFAGDVDDDGYADVIVTGNSDDAYGPNAGTIYLERGPILGDMSVSSADYTFGGESDYDYAGVPSTAGDVDGDGHDDILIGVPGHPLDASYTDDGTAYLLYADGLASTDLGSADVLIYGGSADRMGAAVDAAGDVDDDGYGDFMVGAARADGGANNGGAIYLVYGPVTSGTVATAASLAGAVFYGETADEHLGSSMDAGVDMDADGVPDLLAGAPDGLSYTGAAYVFLSPTTGTYLASEADATYAGEASGDYAANTLALPGDVFGTGAADAILLGARGNDRAGGAAGAAYLVSGIGE